MLSELLPSLHLSEVSVSADSTKTQKNTRRVSILRKVRSTHSERSESIDEPEMCWRAEEETEWNKPREVQQNQQPEWLITRGDEFFRGCEETATLQTDGEAAGIDPQGRARAPLTQEWVRQPTTCQNRVRTASRGESSPYCTGTWKREKE